MSESKLASTIPRGGSRSFEYVVDRIQLPSTSQCPRLLLLIGPCRVGTTALYVALGRAVKAFYQPLKSILRTGLGSLVIPGDGYLIAAKETLGPFQKNLPVSRLEPPVTKSIPIFWAPYYFCARGDLSLLYEVYRLQPSH